MRQIKIILIILYCIILGFMVFCNTSVFGADLDGELVQKKVYMVSSSFDDYFKSMQDEFDFQMINNNSSGFVYAKNFTLERLNSGIYTYFVEKVSDTGYGSTAGEKRGYIVWFYNSAQASNLLSNSEDFYYLNFENFNDDMTLQNVPFNIPIVQNYSWYKLAIYNYGHNYQLINNGSGENFRLPLSCDHYYHPVLRDFILSSTSGGQLTSAINNQTNTIKNESAKVTTAIQNQTQATKEQTNALLDTNSTGNDTMSVNDTTSDTSANLGGLYNQIDAAFTSDAVILFDSHTFNLTLPNGDTFPIVLRTQFFRSFLDNNPVFKAFYQSIFWVIFGGYVIFDFKKIINKMKEGNIDNVVGSSNPVDSVVNMSLK